MAAVIPGIWAWVALALVVTGAIGTLLWLATRAVDRRWRATLAEADRARAARVAAEERRLRTAQEAHHAARDRIRDLAAGGDVAGALDRALGRVRDGEPGNAPELARGPLPRAGGAGGAPGPGDRDP